MNPTTEKDEMRSEYDFSKGIRGKHFKAYRQGVSIVLPKAAEGSKDSAPANHAQKMRTNLVEKELEHST